MQENVLSQRRLYISDEACQFWCWHTSSTEDQHCQHPFYPLGTRHKGMFFYNEEHDLVIKKRKLRNVNFDTYAFVVSHYTRREMKVQRDAENAILGVLSAIKSTLQGEFIHGLPDTELESALLWWPTGTSVRRVDLKTGVPLFPSWSWLGWIGHACYPWMVERRLPMTMQCSPLTWIDPKTRNVFSGEEHRLYGYPTNSFTRSEEDPWIWTSSVLDDTPRHYLHPVRPWPTLRPYNYVQPGSTSSRLRLRTWIAKLSLASITCPRRENYDYEHVVRERPIIDSYGFRSGMLVVPGPGEKESMANRPAFAGTYDFLVLGRSSIDPDPRAGLDKLSASHMTRLIERAQATTSHPMSRLARLRGEEPDEAGYINEAGGFDERVYDPRSPYCLFNVMMIKWTGADVAERIGLGRVHVDAVIESAFVSKEIWLE
jgi:hypothetical protein